jgi:hypothetical protein
MREEKQLSPLTRGLTLIGLIVAGWGIVYVIGMGLRALAAEVIR